ncbi:MAG: BtrH N-terminal domain-containing protein, partial [Acidimicrobiales bacterium]
MTSSKQLKLRIRARMAKTGERYTTARMHVLGSTATPGLTMIDDHGYPLRGGSAAEVAAVANVLTHGEVTRHDGLPLSEAIVFAASGGIGAGYILWEFSHNRGRHLVLGFRSRWQYPQAWITTTLERLHVPYEIHTSGGAKGAAGRLTEELSAGRPVLVLPDRYLLGYWHLPAHLEAFGGHFVVAYAEADGRVHVDDRNLSPLTVSRGDLDAARQRVVSYKNLLVSPRPKAGPVADDLLVDAVSAGLRDCAERLSATSDSFSIPAWRKWGRLMTDPKNAKGWPTVFADRRGLVGALLSIWEGTSALGMT